MGKKYDVWVIIIFMMASPFLLHAFYHQGTHSWGNPSSFDVFEAERAASDAFRNGNSFEHSRCMIDADEMRRAIDFRESQARERAEQEYQAQQAQANAFWEAQNQLTPEQMAAIAARRSQEEREREAAYERKMDEINRLYPVQKSRHFELWWNKVRVFVMNGHSTREEYDEKRKAFSYYKAAMRNVAARRAAIELICPKPSDCRSQLEFINKYTAYCLKSKGITDRSSGLARVESAMARLQANEMWRAYQAEKRQNAEAYKKRTKAWVDAERKARNAGPQPLTAAPSRPDPMDYGSRNDYVEEYLKYFRESNFGNPSAQALATATQTAREIWNRAHNIQD